MLYNSCNLNEPLASVQYICETYIYVSYIKNAGQAVLTCIICCLQACWHRRFVLLNCLITWSVHSIHIRLLPSSMHYYYLLLSFFCLTESFTLNSYLFPVCSTWNWICLKKKKKSWSNPFLSLGLLKWKYRKRM